MAKIGKIMLLSRGAKPSLSSVNTLVTVVENTAITPTSGYMCAECTAMIS